MAHNVTRSARMQQKSAAQLLAIYMAGTLSSAAAEFQLRNRGIQLPIRDFRRLE